MIYNDGTFEENGNVWFVGYVDNILYHIDTIGSIEIVAIIPTEDTDTYRMNPICIKNKNEIICLPDRAKKIMIYNIETKEFREIPISLNVDRCTISNAWVEEDYLWCVSYRSGELIKCNLENKEIKKFSVCPPNYQSGAGEAIKVNQDIYILHKNRTAITEFNIETEKEQVFELTCEDIGFGTIIYANNSFYLTGFKKNIYKWEKDNNRVTSIEIGEKIVFDAEIDNSKSFRFIHSKYVNGYILFIPNNDAHYICNDVILFDLEKETEKIYSFKDEKVSRKFGEYLVYNCSSGEKVLIQDYSQKDYWELDTETGRIRKQKLEVNYEANERFWKDNGLKEINLESDFLRLQDFIMNI